MKKVTNVFFFSGVKKYLNFNSIRLGTYELMTTITSVRNVFKNITPKPQSLLAEITTWHFICPFFTK